ncbi:flavin reductase family protein [Zavarzinia sp.]|uniref:flavin reductase family protein n=1 Tax=Zavarzinia sp. TaxID=2027920 RepID=UPI00356ADCB2
MSVKTFDFATLSEQKQYRILVGIVVPRPIAWVTTLDAQGRINAAPFSFFNVLSSEPPIVALGIGQRDDGTAKDSAANIMASGEFTVNIVSNVLVEAMTVTAITFPPGTDELAEAGLTPAPGFKVACPYIKEARAALECRLFQTVPLPGGRDIILGEVVAAHIDNAVIDDKMHIDPHALDAVGRMGGNAYATTRQLFDLKRIGLQDWEQRHDPGTRRPFPAWQPPCEKL